VQDNTNLLAVLGPTNTGKTYLAFERLISHKSGIFGFPLRLLARENYDKAVARLGIHKIALITGEEKILPKGAKFYFCTVESMPLDIEVECIAIDEVQLAADYERGHIFTDRILNLRGIYETIFLGSLTMEKILLNLFKKIKIQKRDRFSKLSFLSKNSLSKLIPRSAIIAFNINSVYEIAETLKSYKGGAAVVLGSLSPRTRNAQVEIYEDKKVDYLVATDAIGMGLNLNINHVSFSALKKFDGRYNRNLSNAELGQIAGRAGRYHNDGTFGSLKKAGPFDPLIIEAIEEHRFADVSKIYWRNSDIDFSSVEAVINSFKKPPIKSFFIHKKNAEDEINFRSLSRNINILKYLDNFNTISLLWDICRIPDFQKVFNDSYLDLLKNIFITLIENDGILPEFWLDEKIKKLENYNGGIEELSIKISNIRTWTYISNHSRWIKNFQFWQEKTHKIENNLSDHLHKNLTNRFVDFSASFFIDIKNRGEEAKVRVDSKKNVTLNGHNYGNISGFNLQLNISKSESLFSLTHVKKSIRSMIEEKINNFLKAPMNSINFGEISKFKMNDSIKIFWGDEPIGILEKGLNIFSPKAETLNTEFINSDKKILITKKLQLWLDEKISSTLKPLKKPIEESISSEVRAFIFNIFNNLGTMLIKDYFNTIKNLDESDKAIVSKLGIRIGAKFFYMPNLLKKFPMEINALLWSVFFGYKNNNFYPLPKDGRVCFESEIKMPETYWSSIGYKSFDNFAVRLDVFERVFFIARQKIKYGPFLESSDLMNPLGCNSSQLKNILKYCGFDFLNLTDNKKIFFLGTKKKNELKKTKVKNVKPFFKKNIKKEEKIPIKINLKLPKKEEKIPIKINLKLPKKEEKADPNSPFAVLEKLL